MFLLCHGHDGDWSLEMECYHPWTDLLLDNNYHVNEMITDDEWDS